MSQENLFSTVLRNSEDSVRAIESTKMAVLEMTKIGERVVAVLEKTASTNERQTEAIRTYATSEDKWEAQKKELLDQFAAEREKLMAEAKAREAKMMKWLLILLAALFIFVGGGTLLRELNSLGLLGAIL